MTDVHAPPRKRRLRLGTAETATATWPSAQVMTAKPNGSTTWPTVSCSAS
jgi:hypothetical protein